MQGACFNVYNGLQSDKTSLVTYIASEECVVDYITVDDFRKEALNNLNIRSILQIAEERVKQDLVNDIDFFTYP